MSKWKLKRIHNHCIKCTWVYAKRVRATLIPLNKLIQITINIVLNLHVLSVCTMLSLNEWTKERVEWVLYIISNILNEIRIYDPCEKEEIFTFRFNELRAQRWRFMVYKPNGIFRKNEMVLYEIYEIWHYEVAIKEDSLRILN